MSDRFERMEPALFAFTHLLAYLFGYFLRMMTHG